MVTDTACLPQTPPARHTHTQDRLQYTAPLASVQCNYSLPKLAHIYTTDSYTTTRYLKINKNCAERLKPNKFRRAATTVNPSQMTSVYFAHDNEQEREQIAGVHMKDISNTLLEAAYVV